MKLISTHDVNLHFHKSMTVVKETGQVVVSGLKAEKSPVIFLFTPEGGSFKEEEIKPLYEHKIMSDVLAINTHGGEQLGILCSFCHEIKLLNLRPRQVTSAFTENGINMICNGDQNRLFVTCSPCNPFDQRGIIELDCSEIPFKRVGFYKVNVQYYVRLCFAPAPYEVLITGDKLNVDVFSLEKKQQIWTVGYKSFPPSFLDPKGVLFSARHSVLLLCDGDNKRILVLDPKDGSHLQTIELHDMGFIYHLCPHHGKFIMFHSNPGTYKLSYFSVN